MKLQENRLGVYVLSELGEDNQLYFELYMDGYLHRLFKFTITDVKEINNKRISLRGKTDRRIFRNEELYLIYNTENCSFKKPSGNDIYTFLLNQNPVSPIGKQNKLVIDKLLNYKDKYLKSIENKNNRTKLYHTNIVNLQSKSKYEL